MRIIRLLFVLFICLPFTGYSQTIDKLIFKRLPSDSIYGIYGIYQRWDIMVSVTDKDTSGKISCSSSISLYRGDSILPPKIRITGDTGRAIGRMMDYYTNIINAYYAAKDILDMIYLDKLKSDNEEASKEFKLRLEKYRKLKELGTCGF